MTKTLILGDIHGRTIWKDILEKEQPQRIIMLGDYVATHEGISAREQIDNLEEILTLKQERPDDVILLRGNHDLQHLGYYWAECSHLTQEVQRHMATTEFRQRFLSLTQWVHEFTWEGKRMLCSHAGVSKVWLEGTSINEVSAINGYQPGELFAFRPGRFGDYDGDSSTQPCTWIRPNSLMQCAADGYVHIVGHTPQESVKHERINESTELWLADALAHGSYLVLEENGFTVKQL